MKKYAIIMLALATGGLCSCTTFASYSPNTEAIEQGSITPINTLYIVLDALERRDAATAQAHTLYGKDVDWQQVIAVYHGAPQNLRVDEIISADENPEQYNCSIVYYKTQAGHNHKAIFTKIGDKWYWGSKITTVWGTIMPPEEVEARKELAARQR